MLSRVLRDAPLTQMETFLVWWRCFLTGTLVYGNMCYWKKNRRLRMKRLRVHYLPIEAQNEFIVKCSDFVKQHALRERKSAKCNAIVVCLTPDSSHLEQTTFFLLYLVHHLSRFEVAQDFQKLVGCSYKTGSDIARIITETYESLQFHLQIIWRKAMTMLQACQANTAGHEQ